MFCLWSDNAASCTYTGNTIHAFAVWVLVTCKDLSVPNVALFLYLPTMSSAVNNEPLRIPRSKSNFMPHLGWFRPRNNAVPMYTAFESLYFEVYNSATRSSFANMRAMSSSTSIAESAVILLIAVESKNIGVV